MALRRTSQSDTRVDLAEISGSETSIHFEHGGSSWVSLQDGVHPREVDEPIEVSVEPQRIFAFGPDGALVAAPDHASCRRPGLRCGWRRSNSPISRTPTGTDRGRRVTTPSNPRITYGPTASPTPSSGHRAAARRLCSTSCPVSLRPTAGKVLFDGRDVTELPTEERNIAQVFQFPVVYDTMTVFDNLAFPLRNRKISEAEIRTPGRRDGGDSGSRCLPRATSGQPGIRCSAEDLPGSGAGADRCLGDPLRRAADGHRPPPQELAAQKARGGAPGEPADVDLCDPRSDRGPDFRRSSRGDARWRDRPGGHPPGPLRTSRPTPLSAISSGAPG